MEENRNSHPSRLVTKIVIATVIYIIVNLLMVLVPFIPNMTTYVVWGLVFPLLAILGLWVVLVRRRRQHRMWWITGIAMTAVYLLLAYFTLYIIGAMWASI